MRRVTIILGALGVVCLAILAIWYPVVTPRLVKFPTNFDKQLHYAGTFTLYTDPTSGQVLGTPTAIPLAVDRHVYALPDQSTSDTAIVRENAAITAGPFAMQQSNQYAMDRRDMVNVASPLAFAIAPGNRVDRSGAYRLNLPMDVAADAQVPIYKNETGRTYPLVGQNTTQQVEGLNLSTFNMYFAWLPVTSFMQGDLVKGGLPSQLTPAQVTAQLQARGVDVGALATKLLPALSPTESATLATVLTSPVPLNYYISSSGQTLAEPRTGADVKVTVSDMYGIKPDMTALVGPTTAGTESALTILQRHTDVAGVPALITTLEQMAAAAPQPAFRLQYVQTPASVSDMATYVKDQLSKLDLATKWLPLGIGVLGALLLIGAAFTARRRPPPLSAVSQPPVEPRRAA